MNPVNFIFIPMWVLIFRLQKDAIGYQLIDNKSRQTLASSFHFL